MPTGDASMTLSARGLDAPRPRRSKAARERLHLRRRSSDRVGVRGEITKEGRYGRHAVKVITFSLSLGPIRAAKTQWRLRLRSWRARGIVQGPAGSTALPTPPYMRDKGHLGFEAPAML